MPLTRKQVRRIATLARLTFSDQDLTTLTRELSDTVDYFSVLQGVSLEGQGGAKEADRGYAGTRDDNVEDSLPVENVLDNVAAHDGRHIIVPRVIG